MSTTMSTLLDQHDPQVYQIAFSMVKGMLCPIADQILERIGGSEADFFKMSAAELAAVNGFQNKIFGEEYRAMLIERAKAEAEYIRARQISALYYRDHERYPAHLTHCDDAPLMLYTFGNCNLNDPGLVPLAIVGTRHATAYGVDFVKRLVGELAQKCQQRVVIVSGLAFGIDIAAHRAALDSGLPTIAVVAHGLNTVYPAQHRSAAIDIVKHGGMLVTEYTSVDPVHRGNFLARNRIVAGMTVATVVAESAARGGALVTARIAGAYNREVFALPGRTSDPWSEGCNHLIRRHNAHLITCADDLIKVMRWPVNPTGAQAQPTLFPDLTEEESLVLDWLRQHPDSQLRDIATQLDIMQGRLNGVLLELEFKELVICKPGARYCAAGAR